MWQKDNKELSMSNGHMNSHENLRQSAEVIVSDDLNVENPTTVIKKSRDYVS